jgi:hypothetical protein
MGTLDLIMRLVLEGIVTQVPATLVATGLLACAGWLFKVMRRRRTRHSISTKEQTEQSRCGLRRESPRSRCGPK